MIKLYWEIGEEIVEKQEKEGWGTKVLERVAKDLQNEFPGLEGFSRRNVFRMKAFYQAYEKVPGIDKCMMMVQMGSGIVNAHSLEEAAGNTLKSSVQMGCSYGGALIGQALIPIPYVGGAVGGYVRFIHRRCFDRLAYFAQLTGLKLMIY